MNTVTVQNVGKCYVLSHLPRQDTLRDSVVQHARRLAAALKGRPKRSKEEFWALENVSFEVKSGEVVGIIGRNGAGKSTLLKILSRITEPTTGSVSLRGRVGSLLEVGTGFHPELSGRENIFLNGAILGMRRSEIRGRFDAIVDFAEVSKFLDTPVKRYSSGMYVRLAFAVAAHLEPDILIIDEVLAVGDAQFQKKCLGKMGEVAREGRTVLLVSHNLGVISALADRCVLLEGGRLVSDASTSLSIRAYLESGSDGRRCYEATQCATHPHVRRVELATSEPSGVHVSGRMLKVMFDLYSPTARAGLCLSFQIRDQYGQPATHAWIYDPESKFCRRAGVNKWICEINALSLNVGLHTLRVFLSEPPGGQVFESIEGICPFEVVVAGAPPLFGYRPEACACLLPFRWKEGL